MPKRRQLSGKPKSTRGVDAPSDNAQTQNCRPHGPVFLCQMGNLYAFTCD